MAINWNLDESEPGSQIVRTMPDNLPEKFRDYDVEFQKMAEAAKAILIENEETSKAALTLAAESKRLAKRIEDAQDALIEKEQSWIKRVKGFAKPYLEKLAGIEAAIKQKIKDYSARVELERRKAEEAARKATEELQKKLDAEAKAAGVEAPKIELPLIPPKKDAGTVRDETGATAYQKSVWLFEVVDTKLLPWEMMMPDEKKIRKAVQMGARVIPGIKIWEEKQISIRS